VEEVAHHVDGHLRCRFRLFCILSRDPQAIAEFHCNTELTTLSTSLFVLGFAGGPLLWVPMSELYGRQFLFIRTHAMQLLVLVLLGLNT
jgi:hypothetical protein